MTWVELLSWIITGWVIWFWAQRARSVWSLSPENPGRVYVAEFVGSLIISIIMLLFYPLHMKVDYGNIHMLMLPTGIGQIARGDLVIFDADSDGYFVQRIVAFPNDIFSTSDSKLIVNGVVLEEVHRTFLPLTTECQTTVVPENHVALIDLGGTECQSIGFVPLEALAYHCLVVLWPSSESCHSRTNPIPAPVSN